MYTALRPACQHALKAAAVTPRALSSSSRSRSLANDAAKDTSSKLGSQSSQHSASSGEAGSSDVKMAGAGKDHPAQAAKKKTMAELDEELKLKLEGMSGDGGASGLEYENGKAVAMKRGVKENMFRLI